MIYEQKEKAPADHFHGPALSRVVFSKSKAYPAFLARAARLGLDAATISKALGTPSSTI